MTRNVPDPRRWWALALLCGAFFMVILDATIVLVALPSIGADLGFYEQGLQWVLSAYALTFGGLLLLGGRAADLLARRRLFIAGRSGPSDQCRGLRAETTRAHAFSPPTPPAAAVTASTNKRRTDMGKIVISDNVSLDGVIEDPAGDEGFRHGGWVGLIKDRPELAKLALDEALGAEALLLGRRSYEWLAARWPSRSGELADRLNTLPKYVVSSTLEHPDWNNSTVLDGDVVNEVSKLKHELDGEIVVPASFQLVRTLLEHDLVDELRLKIFPVVLGAGERLFGETSDKKPMRLVDTQTLGDGVAFHTYELVRENA